MARGRVRTVCVTGMHRSGTSFAARSLALLGVSFGDEAQLMGPGPDNATGYWENRFVKELDDELLAALGGSWDRPPVLDAGWQHRPELAPFHDRARRLVDDAFGPEGERSPWTGFKDPRLSLLLPFWRTVLPVDATVTIVRDPLEVAGSLTKRNAIAAPHACLLWLRYVLAARADDPDTLVLRHDAFFDSLPATLDALADHLDLAPPDDAARAAAAEHIDPALHHHRAPDAGDDNPLVRMALAVWADGRLDIDAVDPLVARAVTDGWLRSPVDTVALDSARAKVVELTERLRKRARARKAAAANEAEPR